MNNPALTTLDQLYRAIAPDMVRVEAEMLEALRADRVEVIDMIDQAGRFSGKKLRPALALMVARAVGTPNARHYRLGAVVEMIHLATLVHDDVIDGADLRRREKTLNSRWSNFDAVLLGDIIFSRAVNLLARIGDSRALDVLTRAVSTLCEGEILQNRHRNDPAVDEALYYRIIQDKTAALYGAGCELSAHLAGAKFDTVTAFRTYGFELGTGFQIIDDCLDLTGDEKIVGKSLGTDLKNGKMTLPLILLLNRTSGPVRERVTSLVSGGATSAEDLAFLRRSLAEHETIEASLERAREHVARAVAAVRGRVAPDAVAELEGVADFVVSRQR